MIEKKDKSPFGTNFDDDLDQQLQDPEMADHFLNAAVEANDPKYLKVALERVARIRDKNKADLTTKKAK